MLYPISTANPLVETWVSSRKSGRDGINWEFGCNDGAKTGASGLILFDPMHKRDKRHADRYSDRFQRVYCNGLEHDFIGDLSKHKILMDLVVDFIRNNVELLTLSRKLRELRRSKDKYYISMLEKCTTEYRRSILKKHQKMHFCKAWKYEYFNWKLKNYLLEGNLDKAKVLSDLSSYPDSHASIYRDAALIFESKDLFIAKEYMRMAEIIRPSGLFIKKKVSEYNKILSTKEEI